MTAREPEGLRVAIVGPCVAGKSELVRALREAGYEARHVAQEHSYVPAMWQRISAPDVLVFLDVDFASAKARRPYIDWGQRRLDKQALRLAHAREHCDLYIDTSALTREEVRHRVFEFLGRYGARKQLSTGRDDDEDAAN